MNVLVIGSGGREHALCWKIKQSPKVKRLYCLPGNGGIARIAECVDIAADDVNLILQYALNKKIDLTVVGPEASLAAGIADLFAQKGLKVFGPSRAAAQLEGSKVFAKEFMRRRNIPTADYKVFSSDAQALEFLQAAQFPLVVKADGLCAGKGVYVCADLKAARTAVDEIMVQKIFGDAGDNIIIEECLQGPEVSVLAVCDGRHFLVLPTSQDHKRVFDDDVGPNTGGMGAFSPSARVNVQVLDVVINRIIEPAIRGMYQEGNPFKGVLFAGLMLTQDGPKALEFNVRFGDPETQSILPRLQSDIVDIFLAVCDGRLADIKVKWDEQPCVCVVVASGGYPGKYQSGFSISGLDKIKDEDTMVFHAGTKNDGGTIVTSGGRVLGVAALGQNLEAAAAKAYNAVSKIEFDHMFFRRDIAARSSKQKVASP
ncbi:MAG: phosphoribosylamine--glycine ligase [Candidatus Omnitrophica bacterium]|nr:phosphoribosylamine--glycine ligase [Candidatus Omnitrophota bacterium]MDE2232005.1 phosphoribosylamine--glycine ligase [Candidatus Omnitrophota bacterium]